MVVKIEGLEKEIKNAVKRFWRIRAKKAGVLSGKTLDAFVPLIGDVVKEYLPQAIICRGKCDAQVPGYFRPHKTWDALILDRNNLIAALELKSQVGSIGNNFNNRSEEVLGSGIDLETAIEENAFGASPNIFTGYLILVEDSKESRANPRIGMKHFPVMRGFLKDEDERSRSYKRQKDGNYPVADGVSYLKRYDIMCKRLMLKRLYTAAAVITAKRSDASIGNYGNFSAETSVETFITKLASHCEVVSAIKRQQHT